MQQSYGVAHLFKFKILIRNPNRTDKTYKASLLFLDDNEFLVKRFNFGAGGTNGNATGASDQATPLDVPPGEAVIFLGNILLWTPNLNSGVDSVDLVVEDCVEEPFPTMGSGGCI